MSPVFAHGALRLYLLKLLEEQPRHGYDLMQQLEERFEGLYTPSAGTIYPRLARLQSEGLVEPAGGDGGRKTFALTEAGRAELDARRAELADLETEVFGSATSLAREIRADVRASTRDLRAELKEAVREVRRESRRTQPTVEGELVAFARGLAARLGRLDEAQLAALRAALPSAADALIRVVRHS